MKNRLVDLNNHLFAQLERLSEEEITIESLNHEVQRTQAIASMAGQIIDNAKLMLAAQRTLEEYGNTLAPVFETKCLTGPGQTQNDQS